VFNLPPLLVIHCLDELWNIFQLEHDHPLSTVLAHENHRYRPGLLITDCLIIISARCYRLPHLDLAMEAGTHVNVGQTVHPGVLRGAAGCDPENALHCSSG
jgi:hypothetical protein